MVTQVTRQSVDFPYSSFYSVSGSSTSGSFKVSWEDTVIKSGLPGYKTIIARHGDATTPLVGVKYNISHTESSGFSASWYRISDGQSYTASYSGLPEAPQLPVGSKLPTSAQALNNARSAFANSLANARAEFESLQFAGELPETAALIEDRLKSISKLFGDYEGEAKRVIKKYRKKPKVMLKALASLYLEAVFGWAPLFGDIDNFANALSRPISETRTITGRGQDNSSVTSTSSISLVTTVNRVFRNEKNTTSKQVQISGKVLCEKIGTTSQLRFGTSSYSFIPSVYELVPYSFLVDYFSNLGSIVNAVAMWDVPLTFACQTTRTEYIREVTWIGSPTVSGSSSLALRGGGGSASYTTNLVFVDRTKVTNIVEVPDFQFEMPSAFQCLNTLALTVGRIPVR